MNVIKTLKTNKLVAKTLINGVKMVAGIVMIGSGAIFFVAKGVFLSIIESEMDEKGPK